MKKMLQVVHMLQLLKRVPLAQNTINANRNGTAHPLGGQDRLRSYPGNRYQAAHTLFYGTELRWNFDTSTEVLDWYFFSDVLQALQATVFLGTVKRLRRSPESW